MRAVEELAEGNACLSQRLAQDEQHVHELREDDYFRVLGQLFTPERIEKVSN
jgi:hypothetical protein